MSIFRMCPHNNQECVHEIYSGEPDYKWCKKCSVYKSMQNASVKESREYKRFAKKIIKLQKIYNEVCIEQAKINRYGCNAKILLASKINELHTDGNRLEQCVKCCNEKTQCAFYTTTDIFLDQVMRRQGDSGILDLAKMARHKKL